MMYCTVLFFASLSILCTAFQPFFLIDFFPHMLIIHFMLFHDFQGEIIVKIR